MAEAAIQMGAQHKLDLTSDVTHLIVGDSNTPKYQYVAREREDVKVLQLEWVEALRQTWMRGEDVDLEALEQEYRLPTLARLKICLTGFDDCASLRPLSAVHLTANCSNFQSPATGGHLR
jgi:DNA replication regulator DPB11